MEDIKNRIETWSLAIGRLSSSTFHSFKELAEREFCNDYGAALAFLMENLKYAHCLEMIDNHEERITALENKKEIKTRPKTFGEQGEK